MILKDTISTSLLNVESISYHIILPANSAVSNTLFWLHGYQESSDEILCKSNLSHYAEKYQTAVILPNLPDTYYMNHPWEHCDTESFFIQEFIPHIIQKYLLPAQRKHTFLAGASMGGFGSLLIGSHYPELFGTIICISGAFVINDILLGNPEVVGDARKTFSHFQKLFGDIPSLNSSSERNPEIAALESLENGSLPPIYICCGKQDMLYSRNQKLYNSLKNSGAEIYITIVEGGHDWNCFNKAVDTLFETFHNSKHNITGE